MGTRKFDLRQGRKEAWNLIFLYNENKGSLWQEDLEDCVAMLQDALCTENGEIFVGGFFYYLSTRKPEMLRYFIPNI